LRNTIVFISQLILEKWQGEDLFSHAAFACQSSQCRAKEKIRALYEAAQLWRFGTNLSYDALLIPVHIHGNGVADA